MKTKFQTNARVVKPIQVPLGLAYIPIESNLKAIEVGDFVIFGGLVAEEKHMVDQLRIDLLKLTGRKDHQIRTGNVFGVLVYVARKGGKHLETRFDFEVWGHIGKDYALQVLDETIEDYAAAIAREVESKLIGV